MDFRRAYDEVRIKTSKVPLEELRVPLKLVRMIITLKLTTNRNRLTQRKQLSSLLFNIVLKK